VTAAEKPRLSLIVAMAKNRVIGADGKIPWHLPDELQLFKTVTMGHHIIMGRKTYESINRLLPGRTTVIVTRQHDYTIAGAKIAHTLDEAVTLCAGDSEIFVIGGGELYRAALPKADRIYLTVVDAPRSRTLWMKPSRCAPATAKYLSSVAANSTAPHCPRLTGFT